MITDERKHEGWLQTCRNLDQMIADKRSGKVDVVLQRFTLKQLHAAREEAFRHVEETTVDHILALHRLKKELNLYTNYQL